MPLRKPPPPGHPASFLPAASAPPAGPAMSTAPAEAGHGLRALGRRTSDRVRRSLDAVLHRTMPPSQAVGASDPLHMTALARSAVQAVAQQLVTAPGSFGIANVANWRLGVDDERRRTQQAAEAGAALRGSGIDRFEDASAYSAWVWKLKGFVCDELCHAVEDSVARQDPAITLTRLRFEHPGEYGRYAHAVTTLGPVQASLMMRPMSAWPADIVVCDPWAGIDACPAPAYPERFKDRMNEWAANDIGVQLRAGRWEEANEPDCLAVVDGAKVAVVRGADATGGVRYRAL